MYVVCDGFARSRQLNVLVVGYDAMRPGRRVFVKTVAAENLNRLEFFHCDEVTTLD